MKIAFTTLGCPDWSWDKILTEAVEMGYQGIEIRGVEGEMYLPKARPFLPENLEETKQRLKELNLEICCLGSSARFHDPETYDKNIQEAKDFIDLAQKLEVPFVRVFGDKIPDPNKKEETIKQIVEALELLGDYAEGTGVKVVWETHGDFTGSADFMAVFEQIESPNVGILWDVHHPFRYHGEDPVETFKRLGDKVWHTHFKDSRALEKGFEYCLLGEGEMPVLTCLKLLKEAGYDGWYSLEWEKKWHPKIEEPEVAFPHFIKTIRELAEQL